MTRYALDTSVMLRWFSQDVDADTARALQLRQSHLEEDIELVVLDQSLYELLHVLKESAHFDQQRVEEALASLHFMHITVEPFSGAIVSRAVQVAYEHAISLFAAGPVALGAHLRCQTVTCDDTIYRKVSTLPWTALLSRLNL